AEESTASRFTGLVQEKGSDQFGRFAIEVESQDPHRITSFNVRAIPRPAEFPVASMSATELAGAVKAKLEKDAAAGKFSGVVMVSKDGKPVLSGVYGLANRETNLANTMDTKFRIGSMNKMFTAVSILQLVQAGKTGLDDPLRKFLTDYPNKDVASK